MDDQDIDTLFPESLDTICLTREPDARDIDWLRTALKNTKQQVPMAWLLAPEPEPQPAQELPLVGKIIADAKGDLQSNGISFIYVILKL